MAGARRPDAKLDQAAGEDLPAGEFAQWLEAQRTRRRDRVRRALAEQADAAEAARDWDPALIHARDLLALAELQAVCTWAQRIGQGGAVLAAHAHARAAAASGHDPARAWLKALEALALHERGLRSAGDPRADAVAQQGAGWLRRTAQEQVPKPFRDSFLQRNPVNRQLLARAARLPRR